MYGKGWIFLVGSFFCLVGTAHTGGHALSSLGPRLHGLTHTHTHTRAHTHAHTHTHTYAHARLRSHAHSHTHPLCGRREFGTCLFILSPTRRLVPPSGHAESPPGACFFVYYFFLAIASDDSFLFNDKQPRACFQHAHKHTYTCPSLLHHQARVLVVGLHFVFGVTDE